MAALSLLRAPGHQGDARESIARRGRCHVRMGAILGFERINQSGVEVDLAFVRPAAALAAEDGIASGRRLAELTEGVVTKVTQAKRLAAWLRDQLPDAAMREVLMLGVPADDDERRRRRQEQEAQPDARSRRSRARDARYQARQWRPRSGGDQGSRSRNAAPLRRRELTKKVRPPRGAASERRAARSVSL